MIPFLSITAAFATALITRYFGRFICIEIYVKSNGSVGYAATTVIDQNMF
jgi:hypothetical protein